MMTSLIPVLVVGGCAVDEGYRAVSAAMLRTKMLDTSVPCERLFFSAGGVGRNLADVLRKLLPRETHSVALLSAVGCGGGGRGAAATTPDLDAQFLLERCREAGLSTDPGVARLAGQPTAKYVCILDGKGDLVTAAAAMSIFESKAFLRHIQTVGCDMIRAARAVVIDCNLPREHFSLAYSLATMATTAAAVTANPQESVVGARPRLRSPGPAVKIVAIDPISTEKTRRCVPALLDAVEQQQQQQQLEQPLSSLSGLITIIKPNNFEAAAMVEEIKNSRKTDQEKLAALLSLLKGDEDEASDGSWTKPETKKMMSKKTNLPLLPRSAHRNTAAAEATPPPSYDAHPSSVVDTSIHSLSSQRNANNNHNSNTIGGASVVGAGAAAPAASVCHATLHEATRNSIALACCLLLDVVVVSCGGNGSVACFRSMDEEHVDGAMNSYDNSSDTTILRFHRNWHEVRIPASLALTRRGGGGGGGGLHQQQQQQQDRNLAHISCFIRWFPPLRVARVAKVTGAGDTFCASLVSYMLLAMTNIVNAPARESSSSASASAACSSSPTESANDTRAEISSSALEQQQQHFSFASLNAMLMAQRLGIRTWAALPRYAKGALITSAVARASANAVLALTTASGATPQLVPMVVTTSTSVSKL